MLAARNTASARSALKQSHEPQNTIRCCHVIAPQLPTCRQKRLVTPRLIALAALRLIILASKEAQKGYPMACAFLVHFFVGCAGAAASPNSEKPVYSPLRLGYPSISRL